MTQPQQNTSPEAHAQSNEHQHITREDLINVIAGDNVHNTNDIVLTDVANGYFFVEIHGTYVRYAIDQERWYIWNGSVWEEDTREDLSVMVLAEQIARFRRAQIIDATMDDAQMHNRLLTAATQLQNMPRLRAMVQAAARDPRIHTEVDDFDDYDDELVVKNGVVNLKTGEIRNMDPTLMNAWQCSVDYDEKLAETGASDLLEEFLDTFLPDLLDQRFVFATLGHALFKGNERRTLPIVFGGTTSGKSQLFGAVHKILDGYASTINASVFRGNIDDKPRPDLVKAMNTRIAVAYEGAKKWSMHADQIKRLTGNDPITYRDLYKGIVVKLPRFTPILVTNIIPRVEGVDVATKRRITVMHFDKTLEKAKEDPSKRLAFLNDEKCLKAVLARMIQGAMDNIIDEPPSKYILATMDAHGALDSVDEFLRWATEYNEYICDLAPEEPKSKCITFNGMKNLYSHWIQYYADSYLKKDAISQNDLNDALRSRGWEAVKSRVWRWNGKYVPEVTETFLKFKINGL